MCEQPVVKCLRVCTPETVQRRPWRSDLRLGRLVSAFHLEAQLFDAPSRLALNVCGHAGSFAGGDSRFVAVEWLVYEMVLQAVYALLEK